jgi:hypothetical protein
MGWYSNEQRQLGLAYLFLSAENRISDADFVLFEEIGKSIKDFPKIKGEVIGECEKILASSDSDKSRFEIVSELFSEYKRSGGSADNLSRSIQWSLIGLQYRAEKKSDIKQQLVALWAETNQIDKSIVLEMRDTYETAYALSKYQNWLETNKKMSYSEVKPIMDELEKNRKSLAESMSNLIALG